MSKKSTAKSGKMTKEQKRSLGIIFFTVFLDLVGFGMILPLIPYLAKEFQASALEIGYLMALFSGMQFLFSPIWGRLSDRYGRRPIILMSLTGVFGAYMVFAFAKSLTTLFLARAAAGIFSANISTAQAYIADITPKDKRSVGMGLIGAAFGLGFIFGPVIAGLTAPIGEALGSEAPFGMQFSTIVAAGLNLINLVFAYFYLPETKKISKNANQQTKGYFDGFSFVFKTPQLNLLIFIFFLMNVSMALMEVMLFIFVRDRFDWDYRTATFAFAYIGIIMVITQGYFIRKWIPRFGERKVLFCGILLMALAFFGIGISKSIPFLGVVMTFLAVGNGCMRPPIMGLSSVLIHENEQGFVMGVMQSMAAMGRIVGPPLGGILYDSFHHGAPFFGSGLISGIAFVCFLMIWGKLPETQAK